jgi:hypothetical protein
VRDGHTVLWEDAVALFHDGTGRRVPRRRKGAIFQEHEKYPVAGVSCYEAAAYANLSPKAFPRSIIGGLHPNQRLIRP